MKILELTNFSAGICGVWQRVKQESLELSKKGHEVMIFSSNATKGSEEIASPEDKIGKIKIKRFPFVKLGGESFMKWNFEKFVIEFKPDIIIAQGYRQFHTTKALKIAKKINSKVFLVTHAPFIEGNSTRSFFSKIAVSFYDKFIGPATINKFDKVITITKWELPYLLKLGIRQEKIEYIPNGIPEEFFKKKIPKNKYENKILFLGRISPIKCIETLIHSVSLLKNKKVVLDIVGPAETGYKNKLLILIKELNLEKRINFFPAVFDLNKKIDLIDNHDIFVLPSKREAMPQALIEVMAREKIVIASNNPGAKEIIDNGKNGFLFEIGNSKELAEKIDFVISNKLIEVEKEAKKSIEKFKWPDLIKKLEKLF